MATGSLNVGMYKRLTASSNVNNTSGELLGVLIASTTAGTIQLYDSATTTTTTPITGVIMPAAGVYLPLPVAYASGLYAVIGGTIDLTFVYA